MESGFGTGVGSLVSLPGKILDKAGEAVSKVTTNVTQNATVTATAVVESRPVVIPDPIKLGATLTNYIALTNLTLITNITFMTNLVVEVKPAIETGTKTVSTIAGYLPPPYGDIIAMLATGTTGLAGWLASRRGKALNAVIKGVEQTPENAAVKETIADVSKEQGVSDLLHKIVQGLT